MLTVVRFLLLIELSCAAICFGGDAKYIVASKTPRPSIAFVSSQGIVSRRITLNAPPEDMAVGEDGSVYFVNGISLSRLNDSIEEIVAPAPAGTRWDTIQRMPAKGWILADSRAHTVWLVDDMHSVRNIGSYEGTPEDIGSLIGLGLQNSGGIYLLHVGARGIPVVTSMNEDGLSSELKLFGDIEPKRPPRPPVGPEPMSRLARTGGRLHWVQSAQKYLFLDDWTRDSVVLYELYPTGKINHLFYIKYEKAVQSGAAVSAMAYDYVDNSIVVAAFGKLQRYSTDGLSYTTLSVDDLFWQPTAIIISP